jgi:hypothetical protein
MPDCPACQAPLLIFFVGQKWQDVLLTPTKRAARTICATPRKWSASWLSISRSREDDHAADARRKVLDKKRPPPPQKIASAHFSFFVFFFYFISFISFLFIHSSAIYFFS